MMYGAVGLCRLWRLAVGNVNGVAVEEIENLGVGGIVGTLRFRFRRCDLSEVYK